MLMKKLNKPKTLALRSFTGLLLILNSFIIPRMNTLPAQHTDTSMVLSTDELNVEKPAPAKSVSKAQPAVKSKSVFADRVIYVTVTAYSSTPDQTDDTPFITANGTRVRDGIIAANFLKFGAKLKFPDYSGDKIYEVTDRMNARYPNRADIWMATRQDALNFGVRRLKMEILPATLAEK